MAIAFTCSECEKDLKVKDEFAGRKIKCPKCGGSTAVPAAKKAKKKTDDDETEEKEEQPKKKKKKWNRNNSQIVRIIAAAGMLLAGVAVIVVVLIVKLSGKDEEIKEEKKPRVVAAATTTTTGKPEYEKKQYVTGIFGVMDRTELQSLMKNLGFAFKNYDLQNNGKGPANQSELSPLYERNGRISEMLDKRWVTFIFGVGTRQMGDDAARTIIAYQTDKDGTGQRVVVMGNGSVQVIDDPTFQKTKKAR